MTKSRTGRRSQTGSLIHKLIQATGCCHFAQSSQPFSLLPSMIYNKYLSRCSGETSTHRIQYTHLGYDAFKEAVHFRFTITLTVQSCEVPAVWEGSPIRLPTYTDLMLSVPMSHKAIKWRFVLLSKLSQDKMTSLMIMLFSFYLVFSCNVVLFY